jgi:dephospho-CoA kinase
MNRPFVLGVTGSIGMGKSTVVGMIRDLGVPVWDADATVAALYARDGAAVAPIAEAYPQAISDGAVDRAALRAIIAADPAALDRIESIVHPLVFRDRAVFIDRAKAAGEPLVALEIPLLYEKGHAQGLDAVLVVTAPPEVQRARVEARPGMTRDQMALILARQMPDAEKRARADHVIRSVEPEETKAAVVALVARLRDRRGDDA